MRENTVYLMECGGGIGCTEKLHMAITDFMLVINNKHYRFDTTDGNLSILCINGVDEKIGVKQGYKNLVLTQTDSTWEPYEESRNEYLSCIEKAKEKGCSECRYCCTRSIVYSDFCTATGESFKDGIPQRGELCPFKP